MDSPWIQISDYQPGSGWGAGKQAAERARECCAQLESGSILGFAGIPFDFPAADREFLLDQRQSNGRIHKNISYRPKQDLLRGNVSTSTEDTERLHSIMRRFSAEVTRFLGVILTPYQAHWKLDFASFRPEEEQGRDLPLHKRNDLLHVDAFPSRPTSGNRILRCFTNINPTQPRVWITTDRFPQLAEKFARNAGLDKFAAAGISDRNSVLNSIKRALGLKVVERSAYDRFMLRFHDFLKENSDFQANCDKAQLSIPPVSTWMCYTDSVPHAVLSGRFALEQTFIVPVKAMVRPEICPLRILEKIAGKPLAEAA